LEYFGNEKKENFVILKNFNEIKNSENIFETWKIKDFELFVKYDFKTNVFIESPKKPLKNRIPIPNSTSDIKKKISRHDSQILDCDPRNLKKIQSGIRKNSDNVIVCLFYNFINFFFLRKIIRVQGG